MFPILIFLLVLSVIFVLFITSALQIIFSDSESAKKRVAIFGYAMLSGLVFLIFLIGPQHITIPDWIFITGLILFTGIFLYRFRQK